MASHGVEGLLVPAFSKKHVTAMLRHYTGMVNDFRIGEWEDSLGKAGKFIEAVLKSLWVYVGQTVPAPRSFKAGTIIDGLSRQPSEKFDDSIRLTIPRACRFVYDTASNRGGRHDPEEIDPNAMDANVAASVCSWILAEMIRLSQKGTVDLREAKDLVASLTAKMYPVVEDVDGRVYFHIKKKSAPDVALLALAHRYPSRIAKRDLIDTVRCNGFSEANARVAVHRVSRLIDNDGTDNLRLLAPGLKRAEEIMRGKSRNPS